MYISTLNNRTFGKEDFRDADGRKYKKTEYEGVYDFKLTRRTQQVPMVDGTVADTKGNAYRVTFCNLSVPYIVGDTVGGSVNCGRIGLAPITKALRVNDEKTIIKKPRVVPNRPRVYNETNPDEIGDINVEPISVNEKGAVKSEKEVEES